MLKRKVYEQLKNWKNVSQGKSALMIEGARRVGKSFIVEEFAKAEYASHLFINFTTAPKNVKEWFEQYMDDIDRLLMNLQLYYNKQLKPHQSLIVFDEIQDCPKAREAIKFLVADGRFD